MTLWSSNNRTVKGHFGGRWITPTETENQTACDRTMPKKDGFGSGHEKGIEIKASLFSLVDLSGCLCMCLKTCDLGWDLHRICDCENKKQRSSVLPSIHVWFISMRKLKKRLYLFGIVICGASGHLAWWVSSKWCQVSMRGWWTCGLFQFDNC